MFGNTNHIHFIGIGGIGMSGMAELLYKLGFKISGSDQVESDRTASLSKIGIRIIIGHNLKNIEKSDVKHALIFGNEINGVKQHIVNSCDEVLEINQFGTKHSLNVSIAAGIVIWSFFKLLDN